MEKITYMKDTEAAKYLNISVHTLRAYRKKGEGPKFHKLGRSVRYTAENLDLWARGEE